MGPGSIKASSGERSFQELVYTREGNFRPMALGDMRGEMESLLCGVRKHQWASFGAVNLGEVWTWFSFVCVGGREVGVGFEGRGSE